jgi:hypothetical protein
LDTKTIWKKCILGGAIAVALSINVPANADIVDVVSFNYADPNNGNLTASGSLTVDVTTGQALSGAGSIYSDLFVTPANISLGTQSMTLVTSSNRGQNNVDGLGGFLWTDSDGTNIQADTAFSLSAPNVDADGLLFAVGAPTSDGHYASFNFYFNDNGSILGDFLGHGGNPPEQVWSGSSNGTLTINSVSPVPLPAAAWLLLSGIGGLAPLVRKRKFA